MLKSWRLVCYDVRDDKRLKKVEKIVSGYGRRLQYSVFCCCLSDTETEQMRYRLKQIMKERDSLIVMGICAACIAKIRTSNPDIWPDDPGGFAII